MIGESVGRVNEGQMAVVRLECRRLEILALLLALFGRLQGVSALPSLSISPPYRHVAVDASVAVTCSAADAALEECHFRFSRVVVDYNASATSNYSFFGAGLGRGECGIELRGFTRSGVYPVECRVRAHRGGYVYREMSVFVEKNVSRELEFSSSPPDASVVVLPGHRWHLLHHFEATADANRSCFFQVPGVAKHVGYNDGGSDVGYSGDGLDSGDCGMQIKRVADKHNGHVVSHFSEGDAYVMAVTTLIVAKPPDLANILHLATSNSTLTATCTASNSRPVARLYWYLDDVLVRNDTEDDADVDAGVAWRASYDLQSVTQIVTLPYDGAVDDGKVLACRVRHVAILDGVYTESKVVGDWGKPPTWTEATRNFVLVGVFLITVVLLALALFSLRPRFMQKPVTSATSYSLTSNPSYGMTSRPSYSMASRASYWPGPVPGVAHVSRPTSVDNAAGHTYEAVNYDMVQPPKYSTLNHL